MLFRSNMFAGCSKLTAVPGFPNLDNGRQMFLNCTAHIKSDIADLVNSAGREAGCITGGLFIEEFIADNINWAHIDIGGTSTSTKDNGSTVKGGTGYGVATLIELAEGFYNED